VSQVGEQTFDIARTAVLAAGWPETVTGVSIDRQCGSSQQSVHFAAAGLIAGQYDVVVAGGVESMTRVPMGSASQGGDPFGPQFLARYDDARPDQGIGAEMIAEQWGFSRTQLDEYSVASHEKAAAAQDDGRFDAQIAPVTTPDGTVVSKDEGIRRGSSVESLAGLKTVFRPDGGVITAGNASQISDGSAALLMTTSEKARELGLTPIARVHTAVLAGANPVIMLTAPIPATQKALTKSGLGIDEIGVFEVNEAFAPVPLAWLHDLAADAKALNPNGGAIALGHPLGGSGARLMTTMVHHMRDNGIRYGLQTMCEGGGQANATILELL
jgi:acetyl-CoA acyltransferase